MSPWSSTRRTAPRAAAARCAATATRSAPPPSARTCRASRRSRGSAPRCRGSRRGSVATSVSGRSRTGLRAEMALTYDAVFDRVLTRVDPERAHRLGFRAIRSAKPVTRRLATQAVGVSAMGLDFPNALGLAAGFDKNAVGIDALAALGFGFVEIGTVTAQPQPGNPRPRLFRLPADHAIVNRMGFNNDGAEAVARRLAERERRRRRGGGTDAARGPVLGVNVGKTKVVPEDDETA